MTIKTFIEKAIEGGWGIGDGYYMKHWLDKDTIVFYHTGIQNYPKTLRVAEALISPLAWQAVGKVEGWEQEMYGEYYKRTNNVTDKTIDIVRTEVIHPHTYKIFRFIWNLCDGKDLESALNEATT